MHSQSLTQHLHSLPVTAAMQQFFDAPAVQQRLTAACNDFSAATAAHQKAIEGRDHFVNSGSKNGGSKQLPAKLDWKLCKSAHFSLDAVSANFYATEKTTLRTIEREATEKAFDALLVAKNKHIAHLQQRCILPQFVKTATQDFLPELRRIADSFNTETQVDVNASSQTGFAFPTEAVANYFRTELHRRLNAQTLAAVDAKQREAQRLANQQTEEHKAQEQILAGAHSGQTIKLIAEQAVNKHLAPMQRQLDQILQRMQPPFEPQSSRQPPSPMKQPRHRAPHSNASSSQHKQTSHHRNASKPSTRLAVVQRNSNPAASKRSRDTKAEDAAIEHDPSASPHGNHQRDANNKRHKLTVTFAPKNGVGGDRHPRSDQQQPHSSQPANASHHNNARNRERGPRFVAQQPQSHQ